MSPLKPPVFGIVTVLGQQKLSFNLVLSLFIIAFAGCNNKGANTLTKKNTSNNSTANVGSKTDLPYASFDNLHTLYIESDVFKKLFKKKKIVFEFYKTEDDIITLLTWRGKRNITTTTDFDNKLLLKIGPQSNPIDMRNKNVIIGTLEMGGKELDRLEDSVNTNRYKYLVFEPQVIPCTEVLCAGDYILRYSILGSDAVPTNALKENFTRTTDFDLSPNPSPPARAN